MINNKLIDKIGIDCLVKKEEKLSIVGEVLLQYCATLQKKHTWIMCISCISSWFSTMVPHTQISAFLFYLQITQRSRRHMIFMINQKNRFRNWKIEMLWVDSNCETIIWPCSSIKPNYYLQYIHIYKCNILCNILKFLLYYYYYHYLFVFYLKYFS